MSSAINCIIFDLGGVLVDWNPRYLFREHFRDDARMETFLSQVCTPEWIRETDAGKGFAQAIAERTRLFPEAAPALALWGTQWEKSLRGPIAATVAQLDELKARGHRLLALTNWSAETFPIARRRFAFLTQFEDILVSGEHGLAKPDPAIFELACARWRATARHCLFIDDSAANVAAAKSLGFHTLHFRDPTELRQQLRVLTLLD